MAVECMRDLRCINCDSIYERLRPHITEVVESKHFRRDLPDYDVGEIVDCRHQHFKHLHKYEEKVGGAYVFRALRGRTHIVYAVDGSRRLIFLRAFDNYKSYKKFLGDRKEIVELVEHS